MSGRGQRGVAISPELMAAMLSQLGASRVSEAVDRAQDMMFDAMELDDPRARAAVAKRALTVSRDCADAWMALAEVAKTPQEALDMMAEGVAAGGRALGEAAFVEDVGHFWGLIETRPYMRARLAYADALWDADRHDEAVGHAADLLRLNPNDNQGVRYPLLNWLLEMGRLDDTDRLLKQYRAKHDAQWAFPAALAAFRRHGDKASARKALMTALASNPHVADLLCGRRKLPRAMPPYYSPGDRSEAVIYVQEGRAAWSAAPGALD